MFVGVLGFGGSYSSVNEDSGFVVGMLCILSSGNLSAIYQLTWCNIAQDLNPEDCVLHFRFGTFINTLGFVLTGRLALTLLTNSLQYRKLVCLK
jgi:hypothetical protein